MLRPQNLYIVANLGRRVLPHPISMTGHVLGRTVRNWQLSAHLCSVPLHKQNHRQVFMFQSEWPKYRVVLKQEDKTSSREQRILASSHHPYFELGHGGLLPYNLLMGEWAPRIAEICVQIIETCFLTIEVLRLVGFFQTKGCLKKPLGPSSSPMFTKYLGSAPMPHSLRVEGVQQINVLYLFVINQP